MTNRTLLLGLGFTNNRELDFLRIQEDICKNPNWLRPINPCIILGTLKKPPKRKQLNELIQKGTGQARIFAPEIVRYDDFLSCEMKVEFSSIFIDRVKDLSLPWDPNPPYPWSAIKDNSERKFCESWSLVLAFSKIHETSDFSIHYTLPETIGKPVLQLIGVETSSGTEIPWFETIRWLIGYEKRIYQGDLPKEGKIT